MVAIILKAFTLFSIVLLAYLLKRSDTFSGRENFVVVSKIVMYVTLPAAIIANLNGIQFHISLLFICLIGFSCNWIYLLVSYLFSRSNDERSFLMININGFNIGNFALPFILYFVQGEPVLYVSLFDAGSSMMVMSGNYLMAKSVQTGERQEMNLNKTLRQFLSSPAVLAYLSMIILSTLSISLPDLLAELAGVIGGANTFLSMFMLGLALEIHIDRKKVSQIIRILSLRYGTAAVLASLIYFLLPVDFLIKKILMIILFAPVASVAPMFTHLLKGDLELSAQINSLTIVISMILISGLLTL